MGFVELDQEERLLVVETLEDDLSEFRMEIADTSSSGEFKQELKAREVKLKGIIGKLRTMII